MNRFERGFITSGVGLLGAVLIAVPMLAKNMLATPTGAQMDATSGSTGLSPLQLESQNIALRNEIKALKTELTKYKLTAVFTRPTLKSGDRGDDVKGLQLFLSAIPDIYPENVQNGIYGAGTEKAIRTFQDREGLTVNGKADEATMAKVFELITSSEIEQENARIESVLSIATPKSSVDTGTNSNINNTASTNIASVDTDKETDTQNNNSVVSVDTSQTDSISNYLDQISDFLDIDLTPLTLNGILVTPPIGVPTITAVTGAACGGAIDLSWAATTNATNYQVMRDGSQVVQTSNLYFSDTGMSGGSSHTYTVVATDGISLSPVSNSASAITSGPCSSGQTTTQTATSTSTPIAPVITNVASGNISSTGAKITWTTDIAASTQVEYGKTISYGTKSNLVSTGVKSHSATLSGLTTKTTYHYRVISTANSTTTNSTDKTFSTN